MRNSMILEFVELLCGGQNVAGGAAALGNNTECSRDLGTERDALVVLQTHALLIAQWSWVDVFKSLESFWCRRRRRRSH